MNDSSGIRSHSDRLRTICMTEVSERPSEAELDYRRGYAHGYAQAMDDLRPRCSKWLWDRVCEFFDGALARWSRQRGPLSFVLPPSFVAVGEPVRHALPQSHGSGDLGDEPGHFHPAKITRFKRNTGANKTGFVGVSYRPSHNLFYAKIKVHDRNDKLYIGSAKTARSAAILYDLKSIELYGSAVNFPDKTAEELAAERDSVL